MTQGAPLDVFTHNPGDLVRREQVRDLGAGVVTAIFRVVKLATLHAMDNQAIVRQIDDTVAIVSEYGTRTGSNVSILFAHGSIFVGGQLLKANRGVYDGAIELGAVLLKCGLAELTIAKDARKNDIQTFATVIAEAMRGGRPQNLEKPTPRIRLRAVGDAALARGMSIERLSPDQEIVRTYASAIVIMRRFYDALARGQYYLPQRVKRIAQSLVDLSAGETPAFLGVTAVRNANHDEAGRAVNTTILSLAIARQITSDALALVRIAMAALLFDTGRPRLVGVRSGGITPGLSDQQDADMPAATAVVLTALGRVNEPSVMRTVMAYEAHWVKRQALLGPPYRGLRQATIQARIVAVARSFNDLLTPQPGLDPLSADEAIARLEADATEAVDRTVLRLLVGALGIFPTGTLVELSTGEVALVVATPPHPALYSQPRVRLVFNAGGGAADRGGEDVDLAAEPRSGEPRRHIVRVVAMADEASPELRALAKHGAVAPPTSGVRSPMPIQAATFSRSAPTARPEPYTSTSSPPSAPSSMGPRSPATLPSARELQQPTVAPRRDVAVFESGVDLDNHNQSTRAVEYDKAYLIAPDSEEAAVSSDRISYIPAPSSDPPLIAASSPPAPAVRPASPSVAAPSSATATAQGTLARTPLVHLLVYLLDQRLTGSVVFQAPDGTKHCVYLQEGVPSKIQTGTMVAPLDRVVLDMGLLDEPALRETLLEVSKKKILHGRHLVMKGLLDRETVLSVLHLQLVRKLTSLFNLAPETVYAFYEGVNLLDRYGGPELTPCEPLAVVMAGIRMRGGDALVDATLDKLAGRQLALHIDADVRRFDLVKQEAAVVELLRARRTTLADLLAAGVAPERVVRLVIYALMISRHLDIGGAGRAPVGVGQERAQVPPHVTMPPKEVKIHEGAPTRPPVAEGAPAQAPVRGRTAFGLGFGQAPKPPPAPPSQRGDLDPPSSRRDPGPPIEVAPPPLVAPPPVAAPPVAAAPAAPPARAPRPPVDLEARRAEIEKRIAAIEENNFYEILGVLEGATQDQIQAAYFGLAKTWHPDRVPAELADLKPQVSKFFAKVSDAYQTLSDDQKRATYATKLRDGVIGAEEQALVARVVDAALEYQKAEVLLKKHDLAGAEDLARRAVAADPDQPEYLALLVWVQALRKGDPPEGKANGFFDDLIKTLDLILTREPRYERALFYRGMLLKRSGKSEASIRDFRIAAEVNPKNIDAVREVRLFEMRKQKGEPSQPGKPTKPPESAGLFGKFFKK